MAGSMPKIISALSTLLRGSILPRGQAKVIKPLTKNDEELDTSVDVDAIRKKYNLRTLPPHLPDLLAITEAARRQQRHDRALSFVVEKKQIGAGNLTFTKNTQMYDHAVALNRGSFAIMLNDDTKKRVNLNKRQRNLTKIVSTSASTEAKQRSRWKTMQAITNTRKGSHLQHAPRLTRCLDILEVIAMNTHIMMKHYKTRGPRLRFGEFAEMLDFMGLTDADLARRLFELFENRNEGVVDLREMIMGIDVLREKRIDDRADTFFHLADLEDKGTVNEEELYNILKTNMDTREEKLALKLLRTLSDDKFA